MHTLLHWQRDAEKDASPERWREALDELALAQSPRAAVALAHVSGWCLTYRRNRELVLENLLEPGLQPRDLGPAAPERVLALWQLLCDERFDDLVHVPWKPVGRGAQSD